MHEALLSTTTKCPERLTAIPFGPARRVESIYEEKWPGNYSPKGLGIKATETARTTKLGIISSTLVPTKVARSL